MHWTTIVVLAVGAVIIYKLTTKPFFPVKTNTKRPPSNTEPKTKERPQAYIKPGIAKYDIEYGDYDGVVTSRRITVLAVSASKWDIYIQAWCHLREDERTFRPDRIIKMTTVPGGQQIADPVAEIRRFVAADDLPDPEHERFMLRARPYLRPLIWIAHANHKVATEEMAIILDFIRDYHAMKTGNPPLNESKIPAFVDEFTVTKVDAVGALAELSPKSAIRALIAEHAARMSAIDSENNKGRYNQLFPAQRPDA